MELSSRKYGTYYYNPMTGDSKVDNELQASKKQVNHKLTLTCSNKQ